MDYGFWRRVLPAHDGRFLRMMVGYGSRRTRGIPRIPWMRMAGIRRLSGGVIDLKSRERRLHLLLPAPVRGVENKIQTRKARLLLLLLPLPPLLRVFSLLASPWAGERSKSNPSRYVFRICCATCPKHACASGTVLSIYSCLFSSPFFAGPSLTYVAGADSVS